MLKTQLFVFESTPALCLCSAWGCLISSHICELSSSWQPTLKCLPAGTQGLRQFLGRQPQDPSSELKVVPLSPMKRCMRKNAHPPAHRNNKSNMPWKGGQVRYPLISFNDAYWAPTTARMVGPQNTRRAQVLGGEKPQVNDWENLSKCRAVAGLVRSVIDLLKIQSQGSGRVGEICYWSLEDPESKLTCRVVDLKLVKCVCSTWTWWHCFSSCKKTPISAYFQLANTAIFLINTKAA